jgi:hypothetical protein
MCQELVFLLKSPLVLVLDVERIVQGVGRERAAIFQFDYDE